METINNSDTLRELREAAKLHPTDTIPNQLQTFVQPVMEVNPRLLRRVNILKRATTGTIYTTPADRDFYLTGLNHSASSSQSGNNVSVITAFLFGDTTAVGISSVCMTIVALTTDNSSGVSNSHFTVPLKLARNTAIAFANSGTVGPAAATIIGYIDDLANA